MKCKICGTLPPSYALTALALGVILVCSANAASWVANGPMTAIRQSHTATLLQNGKVLVAGGFMADNSAELLDPATGTWTATESMNAARWNHTATLLPNGKVLVVGGRNSNALEPLYSGELYDPATGKWTVTGPLNVARAYHIATLLTNGKVLVAGGDIGVSSSFDSGLLYSAELYDPDAGTWTMANPLSAGRAYHTATLLPNGQVLVVGGNVTSGDFASTELYNPTNGMWSPSGEMQIGRDIHTATLLSNGKVLVAGGYNGSFGIGALVDSELYDPVNEIWTTTGQMNVARESHSATLLPNGTVLVTGGNGNGIAGSSSVEIYDPGTETWTTNSPLNVGRNYHTATLLPNGKTLVAGGQTIADFPGGPELPIPTSSTEVYDPTINPATGTNTVTGAMRDRLSNHQAILLPNGKVLVAGGEGSSLIPSSELFSPSNGAWAMSFSMTRERDWGFTLTLLPDGTVLAKGGNDYSGRLFSYESELYNPATGGWTGISPPETDKRILHSATLLLHGKVLVAGGLNRLLGVTCFASAELYEPSTKAWNLTGAMRSARWGHVATLLPTGKVLVAGGATDFDWNRYVPVGVTNSAELYDPASGTWTNTGAMNAARIGHTATLLPNGKVLVAGGGFGLTNVFLSSAELYDPVAGTWTNTGGMNNARGSHSATLLPGGKVMVAGGYAGTNYLSSVELYDPATGTWTLTGNLNFARRSHTATLLPSGKVLIAGGYNGNFAYPTDYVSSAELYDAGLGYSNVWRPQITTVTSPVNLGGSLVVTGAQFRGIAEGSSGNTQDSSTDYPLVQLRSLESGQTVFLSSTNWGTNSFTSLPVWNFPPGYALATVFVNGIQSTSSIVNISVPIPASTVLACTAPTNGEFQFCFTNNPGALFGVLTTTNLSLPLANWTRLSGITEIAPGHFQFSDPQTTNNAQRFYSLFAP